MNFFSGHFICFVIGVMVAILGICMHIYNCTKKSSQSSQYKNSFAMTIAGSLLIFAAIIWKFLA